MPARRRKIVHADDQEHPLITVRLRADLEPFTARLLKVSNLREAQIEQPDGYVRWVPSNAWTLQGEGS